MFVNAYVVVKLVIESLIGQRTVIESALYQNIVFSACFLNEVIVFKSQIFACL